MHNTHSHESSPSKYLDLSHWHVDIDTYINPFLPPPPWRWLPTPISHFLGYRGDRPPKAIGNLVIAFWSLLGVFCGVLVVAEVSMHVPLFENHHASIIVASFVSTWFREPYPCYVYQILILQWGAAAVLQFSAIESPFAQPRNAIMGQLFASVIGVSIRKLFALNPYAHSMPQLGGALACAITTTLMVLTNTTHPPAGATALLAVTEASDVGWYLIPIMLLGCTLMLAVALLINNIQRRFPVYWWTAHSLSRKKSEDTETARHAKEASCTPSTSEDSLSIFPAQIIIRRGKVLVPDNIWITAEEKEVLEKISERM